MMPQEVWFTLSPDPASVSEARRRVTTLDGIPDDATPIVQLVVSELVTNSVLHAGLGPDDAIAVRLRRSEDRLEIEVDDGDGFYGSPGPAIPGRSAGLGLRLLNALCESWHAEAGRVRAYLRIEGADPFTTP